MKKNHRQKTLGNIIVLLTLSLVLFIFNGSDLDASWFVDAERYHISVHGQTSCFDCHAAIGERDLHPDSKDIDKDLQSFFSVDQCLDCHDDVIELVEEVRYCKSADKNRTEPKTCIDCHNPHYQLTKKEITKGFDPATAIHKQCDTCHDSQTDLPEFPKEDRDCVDCHLVTAQDDPENIKKTSALCFHCHELEKKSRGSEAQPTTHEALSCLSCHPESDTFGHSRQQTEDCRLCHQPHAEETAHDLHAEVSCQACHLSGAAPVRNADTRRVVWQKDESPQAETDIHRLVPVANQESCRRCHSAENSLGAADMVLPAKSVLCMACHASTFTVDDNVTRISLLVFLLGFLSMISVWLSGNLAGIREEKTLSKIARICGFTFRTIFSTRIVIVVKVLFLDALLQRRLYRQSRGRWFVHGLIFFPFVIRFVWGITALTASSWNPGGAVAWDMLNKNHPLGAFLFDLTGVMIMAGVILAIIRKLRKRSSQIPGLPGQDKIAVGLIGGIVMIGFLLEGIRMVMTGIPAGGEWAFLGYGISRLLAGSSSLTGVFGYVWYAHAVLTGLFVAYLPFSRMFHIIMAPVVLAINAAKKHR
ncbi:MAG: hypothetical protein GY866_06620 [Proteobacteria bacterium]|nr:hypothetical protein [Pseudomonadota bacterium]